MNEDKFFDLRRFNITNVEEAIQFVELVSAKLPQISVILNTVQVDQQVLLGRAEYAEGKRATPESEPYSVPDNGGSVGDRLTGQIVPTVGMKSAAERLGEMRAANGVLANAPLAPGVPGALGVATGSVTAPGASPSTAVPTLAPPPTEPISTSVPDPAAVNLDLGGDGQAVDLAAIAAGQVAPPSFVAPDAGAQPPAPASDPSSNGA